MLNCKYALQAVQIQTLFRRYLARKKARLAMLEMLHVSTIDSFEEELEARANDPKSKQDFQRLYAIFS